MFGALAKRERRPLWVAAALVLVVVVGGSLFLGARARSNAVKQAAKNAELAAQVDLAPLLMPRDLMTPVIGVRAAQLTEAIEESVLSKTGIGRVRLYSSIGRVLYSADPKLIGTRPSYLRDLATDVANGDAMTQVHSGMLQTYVPIWLNPDGTVAVAEMSQAYGPITAGATGMLNLLAFVAGALFLGCVAMVVVTSLAPAPARVRVAAPQAPARQAKELQQPTTDSPLYQQAGFRALEEQRQAAETRAAAAEENYRTVQKQLKATLAQMKELEGRLTVQGSQNDTTETELQALRDQLRDTAERLHKAELDNNQLRERMALRQRELEEARHQIATIETQEEEDDGVAEIKEMKERLVLAEKRAKELGREAERLEAELDYTKRKFHMSKLSEALREFDNDDVQIDVDEDDLFEHPVIIRGGVPSGKVR